MTLATPIAFELSKNNELTFGFSVSVQTGGAQPYTGEYEVTPKIYEPVSLETKNRFLRDNVTVKKIPQYVVSNDAGGNTLIMGDEYFG